MLPPNKRLRVQDDPISHFSDDDNNDDENKHLPTALKQPSLDSFMTTKPSSPNKTFTTFSTTLSTSPSSPPPPTSSLFPPPLSLQPPHPPPLPSEYELRRSDTTSSSYFFHLPTRTSSYSPPLPTPPISRVYKSLPLFLLSRSLTPSTFTPKLISHLTLSHIKCIKETQITVPNLSNICLSPDNDLLTLTSPTHIHLYFTSTLFLPLSVRAKNGDGPRPVVSLCITDLFPLNSYYTRLSLQTVAYHPTNPDAVLVIFKHNPSILMVDFGLEPPTTTLLYKSKSTSPSDSILHTLTSATNNSQSSHWSLTTINTSLKSIVVHKFTAKNKLISTTKTDIPTAVLAVQFSTTVPRNVFKVHSAHSTYHFDVNKKQTSSFGGVSCFDVVKKEPVKKEVVKKDEEDREGSCSVSVGRGGEILYVYVKEAEIEVVHEGERVGIVPTTSLFGPPIYTDESVIVQMSSQKGVGERCKSFLKISDYRKRMSVSVDMTRRLYGRAVVHVPPELGGVTGTHAEHKLRAERADMGGSWVFNEIKAIVRDRENRWMAGIDQEGNCHFLGM